MARGFRIGWPGYMDAWRVLDFEYTELDNVHILDDLADFLKIRGDWPTVLAEFRRRHGEARGAWLCPTIRDAVTYYGKYYGEGVVIEEWEYDPRNVISDLGPDGFFVINATFVRERGVDPLEPLKRDLARIFRWPRR